MLSKTLVHTRVGEVMGVSVLTLESQLGSHLCKWLHPQRKRRPFGVIWSGAKMCIDWVTLIARALNLLDLAAASPRTAWASGPPEIIARHLSLAHACAQSKYRSVLNRKAVSATKVACDTPRRFRRLRRPSTPKET